MRLRMLAVSLPVVLTVMACRDDASKAPPVASAAATTTVAAASAQLPAAAAPDTRVASACDQLARKCHGHADTDLAKACHRMGHAAKSEDECVSKTAECLAACSGGEEKRDVHAHMQ